MRFLDGLAVVMERRRLRIFKWAGLAACLVLTATLVWTLFYTVSVYQPGWGGAIGFGAVGVATTNAQIHPQQMFSIDRRFDGDPMDLYWWVEVTKYDFGGWGLMVPLWIPFVLTAIPTVVAWRRDRRPPPGHCQKCGYDLTGNESGVCPECGSECGRRRY